MLRSNFFLALLSAIYCLLPTTFALAEEIETFIHHVAPSNAGEPTLVMLGNGQVGLMKANDKIASKSVEMYQQTGETLKIELDNENNIIGLRPSASYSKNPNTSDYSQALSYEPTRVTEKEAQEIFRRMRTDNQRRSQCYNRAHVWAYEEWKRSNRNLMKVFVFYTQRYIRDYRFYWWFHAVPGIYVGNELVTLDREFASFPLGLKDWSDIFVESGRACPIISKYSDYENNQQTEHCYIHPATMYFWQPRDLETFEQTGEEKTSFIPEEVRHAYWEAF